MTILTRITPNLCIPVHTVPVSPVLPAGRFLSREECTAMAERAAKWAVGGGETSLHISSEWNGNIRWARNEITSGGDIRDNLINVQRSIRGATAIATTNQIDNASLEAAVHRAERIRVLYPESLDAAWYKPYVEPYAEPHLWFDSTYQLDTKARADAAHTLVTSARKAGMLAAGYIEVGAIGMSVMNYGGKFIYHSYTKAQYSVTVRSPDGTASGWAGIDHNDWSKIDAVALTDTALDKCLRSRNPVALEPGRYTTILEPQAVCDIVSPLLINAMDRVSAENWPPRGPFSGSRRKYSKIGERVIDTRLTIGVDPYDPAMAFLPIDIDGTVHHAVDWIKDGVLCELAYQRDPYGVQELGKNTGLPNAGAFRMSGGTTTIDDMITSTRRGVLVTRFSDISMVDYESMLLTGFTRDGLWLIENGKISKAIKNFRFTDSPLFMLNQIEAFGVPTRTFHPEAPVVVPSLKVRDFSFTALSDAV